MILLKLQNLKLQLKPLPISMIFLLESIKLNSFLCYLFLRNLVLKDMKNSLILGTTTCFLEYPVSAVNVEHPRQFLSHSAFQYKYLLQLLTDNINCFMKSSYMVCTHQWYVNIISSIYQPYQINPKRTCVNTVDMQNTPNDKRFVLLA